MYSIEIKTKEKQIPTSPSLYGLFFEDINRAGDGGLYAELLRNRAFDDGVIPEGCRYDTENKLIISPTGWSSSFDCCELEGIAAWKAINGAEIRLTDKGTLNANRKRALQIKFGGGTVLNDGFMGIPVESGKKYRFYMFAKCEKNISVSVMLTSENGKVYAKHRFEINGEYNKYECEFESNASDHNARFALSSDSNETVTLGFVSLFPRDTFLGRENGLRKSLAERLLKLKPAFLRFPGGCIVEGFTKETAFRFKDTIGPVWERKPHWLLWSYMTTNGLGFHEYLQFCEDANIDAMYVFNCGMTCQGRCPDYFDEKHIEEFYEDTVHAILYATAPADTEWGAKRAENGHPEPFLQLKYIEIGNENWGVEYNKRYEYFYKKLKAKFPQFTYISTDHTEKAGLTTEFVDEHFYSDPIFFAANTKLYDDLDRQGVNIYCGEYAATIGVKQGTLYGALGEAAFLTGIERNQDKVRMTSYAPLFKNVDYVSWEPDMIVFNNHEDYAIPSYYMLKMFAENRGDFVCGHTVNTESDRRIECGHFTSADGTVIEGKSFSTDIEGSESLRIRFWDRGTVGEEQNHYDWIIENGVSKVVHYNGWSAELICKDVPCNVPCKKNHVEITADEDSFIISFNGEVIHDHILSEIPHITAVCTIDENSNEVITKVVNFSERDVSLRLSYDTEMDERAEITTLTADSRNAQNSFESPTAVVPNKTEIAASKDCTILVKQHSINVLRHKMIKK